MAAGDKAVLLSIRPWWVSMIATGKKTVEVRKTRPKLDVPFKCYLYMTKERGKIEVPVMKPGGHGLVSQGKIMGEFICDGIKQFYVPFPAYWNEVCEVCKPTLDAACLTYGEAHNYLGHRTGYAWHINQLQMYKHPVHLFNFKLWHGCINCKQKGTYHCLRHCKGRFIERAPMSWCYVEEIDVEPYK